MNKTEGGQESAAIGTRANTEAADGREKDAEEERVVSVTAEESIAAPVSVSISCYLTKSFVTSKGLVSQEMTFLTFIRNTRVIMNSIMLTFSLKNTVKIAGSLRDIILI